MKSIARIDQERRFKTQKGKWSTRSTRGWYVQVAWNGKKHTKFFSDGKLGGKGKARLAAIAWRDATELKIGKPQTSDPVIHPRYRRKDVGVSLSEKDGSPVFHVSWVEKNGRHGRTTVSIKKWGKNEAKKMALAIREERHHAKG
jgi:hypothetical protein